jgi:sulfonate transport system permease protein
MATTSVAAPARPRGALLRWRRLPIWFRYAVVLAALIGVWQLYWTIKRDQENFHLLFAGPASVAEALWEGWSEGTLASATWTTLKLLVVGIGIGAGIAALLSAFATLTQIGADVLSLLTAILNPLPGIAVLPLAMLWFGLNNNALLFVIANATIWPIAISVTTGFRTANPTIVAVGRNIGLGRARLVTDVLAPAALPHAISGVRTAWAFGWRTIIAAELVFGVSGVDAGLGFFINNSKLFLQIPQVFAGLITIMALGVLFEWLFAVLERRTVVRWGMKSVQSTRVGGGIP